MPLNTQEAAALLGVSPETLQRWARQGMLGMRRPDGEMRFQKMELEAWARRRGLRLSASRPIAGASANAGNPLAMAMERGSLFSCAGGTNSKSVLAEFAGKIPLAKEEVRSVLEQQLQDRENLGTTGLGHGIALPHPRTPNPLFGSESIVFRATLAEPTEWAALDGQPVQVVLLLLNPDPSSHLQVLSRLAFLLRNDNFCQLLREGASQELVLREVRRLEPQNS